MSRAASPKAQGWSRRRSVVRASIGAHLPCSPGGACSRVKFLPGHKAGFIRTARVYVLHRASGAQSCSRARLSVSEASLVPLIKKKLLGGRERRQGKSEVLRKHFFHSYVIY